MRNRHLLLYGIMAGLALLAIAVLLYPGGSRADAHSVGFDWKNNYLSNLFERNAINGAKNSSQVWAISGWLVMCFSLANFFIAFSKKIAHKGAARMIRYCGLASMIFAFLAVTPLHDTMITLSCTVALLSIFYITVFIFKSRLIFFKIYTVVCLLICYSTIYIYYSGKFLEILPTMQKATLLSVVILMLSLHYLTKREDFQLRKA